MKMKKFGIKTVSVFFSVAAMAVFLAGCTASSGAEVSSSSAQEASVIRIGVTPSVAEEIALQAKEIGAKDGLNLEVITFSDYTQINRALAEKQIDANAFQHTGYFENDIKTHQLNLVKLTDTYTIPMAVYSSKIKAVSELPDGATVALPGDPANTARGLAIFEKAGWIKVRDGAGLKATVKDVVDNPRHIQFKEMDQAMIAPILDDVDAAAILTPHALQHGLNPLKDGLIVEDGNSPWVNLIAVRPEDKDKPAFKKLVQAFHSDEMRKFIEDKYQGAVLAGW